MYLYKVSPPRENMMFEPSLFYRSDDYAGSATKPRPGYVPEMLLYAGEFADVAIHLLTGCLRIYVRGQHGNFASLKSMGLDPEPGTTGVIFIRHEDHSAVMSFSPTVYVFESRHFDRLPSNEYVARKPVTAVRSDTWAMADALRHWQVGLKCVEDVAGLKSDLLRHNVTFSVQD